ncbi:dephospho-CoA kinase [Clostridium sp. Marseille-P2415]|uniref:dephospho-CoA kinase n=1 Tax=Clostridium sp. Marseille-P2415 TaxID=1805471 RepID=UPI00098856DB|nr:dephospho-CoA kinase [Clostridium sp. Marseille-P2415]
MRVIGLTGGVGAGKSLVLHILEEEYGAEVIKADDVAHELMEPGRDGYLAVIKALGDSILKPDGTIDRQLLSGRIFQDENTRKTVNGMIHPMVWKTIRDKISASQAGLIVVEFAIMGEKADSSYDEMWYVRASEQNRIRRLAENRGYTRERSERMIASQASESEFLARCDRVIENNGSIEEVKGQLAEILKSRG